ncbi:MAG: single-stranded DNA-binding protein [Leptonema sp. (in: bacteria)]
MKNLSLSILDGNLVQDPEMRAVGDNQKVTQFVIAVNHGQKGDLVSFFPVEVWGRNAENCKKYLRKGSRVTLIGSLRQDRWTDDKGQVHSRIKIIASQIRFDSKGKKSMKKQEVKETAA